MEEAAAMDEFEDPTAKAAVRGRGRGKGVAGAEARAQGRMLLSQAMEAGAGVGAEAESGGGAEGGEGEEGLSQWRCPRSQKRTRLKRTQTCKSRGCCDAGRECQKKMERVCVQRNDWRCLQKPNTCGKIIEIIWRPRVK